MVKEEASMPTQSSSSKYYYRFNSEYIIRPGCELCTMKDVAIIRNNKDQFINECLGFSYVSTTSES